MKRFVFFVIIAALIFVSISASAFAQIEFIDPSEGSEASGEVEMPTDDGDGQTVSPDFRKLVDDLAADGKISNADGEFYFLDDFVDEWAQIGWYQWIPRTGPEMNDFVLRSKIKFESASQTPNWGSSGCGWFFRGGEVDTHLNAYYTLEGNVRLRGFNNDYELSYGRVSYGRSAVTGEIDMVIYAEGPKVGILIDGVPIIERSDVLVDDHPSQLFSVTFSGTNQNFGIRCSYSDVEFMILK